MKYKKYVTGKYGICACRSARKSSQIPFEHRRVKREMQNVEEVTPQVNSTNQLSYFSLQYRNKRIPYETECDDSIKLTNFQTYTSDGCYYDCLSKKTLAACKCRDIGDNSKGVCLIICCYSVISTLTQNRSGRRAHITFLNFW